MSKKRRYLSFQDSILETERAVVFETILLKLGVNVVVWRGDHACSLCDSMHGWIANAVVY